MHALLAEELGLATKDGTSWEEGFPVALRAVQSWPVDLLGCAGREGKTPTKALKPPTSTSKSFDRRSAPASGGGAFDTPLLAQMLAGFTNAVEKSQPTPTRGGRRQRAAY